jgi:hypothetical protein
MSEYHAQSPKREKRRKIRERSLGPERRIVSSSGESHVLECGHRVLRMKTEFPHIKRRRCVHCRVPLARALNRSFAHVPEAWRPEFCEGCGASNSFPPATEGEPRCCRECGTPWREP